MIIFLTRFCLTVPVVPGRELPRPGRVVVLLLDIILPPMLEALTEPVRLGQVFVATIRF